MSVAILLQHFVPVAGGKHLKSNSRLFPLGKVRLSLLLAARATNLNWDLAVGIVVSLVLKGTSDFLYSLGALKKNEKNLALNASTFSFQGSKS